MVGNAALRAAQALLRVLVDAAAKRLDVPAERIEWLGEGCRVAGEERGLDFAAVVSAALAESGTLTVKGTWSTPPETQGGKHRGAAVGSTAGFSYAAQVVEVSVDEETGAGEGGEGLGRARLRLRASTRSPSRARCRAPCGWAWARRCRRRRSTTTGLHAAAELPRLPHPDDRRIAADRGAADREPRPARPLRRQGGERRRAARLPAGAHQRDRRRDRHRASTSCRRRRTACSTRSVSAGAPSKLAALGGAARPRAPQVGAS